MKERISNHAYKLLLSRKLGAYFGDVALAFELYGRNFAAIKGFLIGTRGCGRFA